MTAEERLIQVYLLVCEIFPAIAGDIQRYSPNQKPLACSDEEILTIYLFGILQKHFTVKDIHNYFIDHWLTWFPTLPKYEGFNHRLGRLGGALQPLLEILHQRLPNVGVKESMQVIDSMPIVMAKGNRSSRARVARELADKGYCASKKMYYHGLKLHAIVGRKIGSLGRMTACEFSRASEHDMMSFRRQIYALQDCDLYGDKAYFYHECQDICRERNIRLHLVKPRVRGRKALGLFEQVQNTNVSRVRQAQESWFNWLEEKTHIGQASKVRSVKGLNMHIFGKLAAAFVAIIFNF